MSRPASYEEICLVARTVVDIFARHDFACCLVGSTACALYGGSRCPNDVDLVVITERDPEDLKKIIAEEDTDFYLVPSRSRDATYEVLWCELPSHQEERHRGCKVDILIPGVLDIPNVPSDQIEYSNRLPLMPLLPLLLLKLKGWSDHRDSNRTDFQDKQYVDVEDIDELLLVACEKQIEIGSSSSHWLPEAFVDDGQERVLDYIEEYPESTWYWRELGFEV